MLSNSKAVNTSEDKKRRQNVPILTLKDPIISEICIKIKIELNFYFHTSLWCLKRFYEGLKGLKPFEAPQRSVKMKIKLNFYFNTTFRNALDGKG